MSIDAVIAGASELSDGTVVLNLEPRGADPAGQQRMTVIDPPEFKEFAFIVGCEVWGNSSVLLVGDTIVADRVGYTSIKFRNNFQILAMSTRAGRVMKGS